MSRVYCLGGNEIDIELAVRRTFKDMRDDWFADPLQFRDILKPEIIEEYLSRRCGDESIIRPSSSEQFNIPKNGFTLRYTLETNVFDRAIYQGLVDIIAEKFDSVLHARVYSHRVSSERNQLIFRHVVESWRMYLAHIKAEFESGNNVLLVTDIQNFFESIHISDLNNVLLHILAEVEVSTEEHGKLINAISGLISMLNVWTAHDNMGIPQNRDASSLLANLFLNFIDHEMLDMGYRYFRYMDDIRIVCNDEFEARRALRDLIVRLRRLKLNVNSRKTQILFPSSEAIAEFIESPDRELEQIDSMWRSRQLPLIQRAIPLLFAYSQQLISDNKMDSRAFRFCIARLEMLARFEPLRAQIDFSRITDAIVGQLIYQPWSTDSIVRYLRSVPLSESHFNNIKEFIACEARNIYEWQAYQLWQLMAFSRRRDDYLIDLAKNYIKTSEICPELAGGAIYLGVNGDENDKIYIAENFSRLPDSFLVQRNCIIAMHELNYGDVIERYVKDYVKDEVRGMYRRLANESRGNYFNPLEPKTVNDLYRDIPDHIS